MDFEKICMMFTMQEPYYGIILSSMVRTPVPASRCPTMAVSRSGSVFRLIYNPDFVNRLDTDTICQCLRHEVLHLAFNHFTLFDKDPEDENEHFIRNMACDLEVNCYIDTKKMRGVDPVTVDKFGYPAKLGTKEYLRRLINDAQQQQQQKQQKAQAGQNVQTPCNGGKGGKSNGQNQTNSQSAPSNPGQNNGAGATTQPQSQSQSQSNGNQISKEYVDKLKGMSDEIDDHSMWPDDDAMSEEEKSLIEQQIEDMLVFAADEVEKSRGTLPGEMVGRIEAIRNKKKPKPVADWKRYLRRYMGNEFSEFIRKSKKRESRRFPDAAGNKHRRKSHILVAIDTSGSVSMPEYQEFFGQIKTLTSVADFHVVECDAIIQHEYDYHGKANMTLHGGGGTSFQPPVDIFNRNKHLYDALIYFTDGECPIPFDTPRDTLWVVSSKGDQSSRKRYQVNGASVAFIPKQK